MGHLREDLWEASRAGYYRTAGTGESKKKETIFFEVTEKIKASIRPKSRLYAEYAKPRGS
jgi:hypothetical protein